MRSAGIGVLAVVALVSAVPVTAQDSRRQELEEIRAEIARLQARLTRVAEQSRGISGELERTELSLALQGKRLEEAQAARRLTETTLVEVEEQVTRLQGQLERHRDALQRRLTDLYRLGRQGYLRLLLSVRSRRQLLPAVRALRYLARRDGALLDRYLDTRAELAVERQELLRRRRERQAWEVQENRSFEELNRLRRRQSELLARLQGQRDELAVRAEQLTDKARKLSNLMAFLAGRSTAPLAGRPMQEFRGALDWPARGRVELGFGTRREPRYGTLVPHNGLELTTRPGDSVRVIYPGKVVFAAPFEGYGQTVVVHHSGRVFTLYAGLGRLAVQQEDILRLGQPVGVAAASLYFEIREENRPVDPRAWLR